MSPVVVVLAVVAILVYTIGRQVTGEPIRAKRLIVLPGVLTVIGVINLAGHKVHPGAGDVVLIAAGGIIAAGIGLTLGSIMRLEQRDGWLWGQLPKRGIWLWVALISSRVVLLGIAHATGAHVAAGTDADLLILGVNRLAQAAVVGGRALVSGIPFAPEKNGSRPLSGIFG